MSTPLSSSSSATTPATIVTSVHSVRRKRGRPSGSATSKSSPSTSATTTAVPVPKPVSKRLPAGYMDVKSAGRSIVSRRIADIVQDMNSGKYAVPGWQRNADAWTLETQQCFIDSIFRGFTIPIISCFLPEGGDDLAANIVDGLQRLTALSKFMKNEFPFYPSEINEGWRALGEEEGGNDDNNNSSTDDDRDNDNEKARSSKRTKPLSTPASGEKELELWYSEIPETRKKHRFKETSTLDKTMRSYFDNFSIGITQSTPPMAEDVQLEYFNRIQNASRLTSAESLKKYTNNPIVAYIHAFMEKNEANPIVVKFRSLLSRSQDFLLLFYSLLIHVSNAPDEVRFKRTDHSHIIESNRLQKDGKLDLAKLDVETLGDRLVQTMQFYDDLMQHFKVYSGRHLNMTLLAAVLFLYCFERAGTAGVDSALDPTNRLGMYPASKEGISQMKLHITHGKRQKPPPIWKSCQYLLAGGEHLPQDPLFQLGNVASQATGNNES